MPSSADAVAVVMPAYNEEGCVEAVVSAWLAATAGLPGSRVIVVDDGSRDRTGAVLDALAAREPRLSVLHQANAGHGAALRRAYEAALGTRLPWVFHVDSDDQFSPQDFAALWAVRRSSRFLLGCRKVRHDAPHRLVISKTLKLLNFALFGVWVPDCNIPFRLIRSDFLAKLLAEIPAGVFAPNVFLAVLAAKAGEDLGSRPVSHRDRATGQVSIIRWGLVKACLRSARELAAFRLRLGGAVARVRGA